MSVAESLTFIWAVGMAMAVVLSWSFLIVGDLRRGARGILLCWAWPVVLIVTLVRAAR